MYNGSSYVAKQSTIGNVPTNEDYWQLLSAKGDTGPQGIQGEKGDKGDKGDSYILTDNDKQDIAKINQKTKEEEKNEIINQIKTEQAEIRNCITELTNKTNLLLESDKDDIKSFITKEHHYFCYKQKWIDDYSLDCCEKRYAHYKAEKGNSFIEGFMEELRALPKTPNIKK